MPTHADVRQQILALGPGSDFFITKKEVKYLPEAMHDDEKIVQMTFGMTDIRTWLMVCTNKRVLMLGKGMFYGLMTKQISLKSISAVEHKVGFVTGEITITVSSEQMHIEGAPKQTIKPFVDALNAARRAGEATPSRAMSENELVAESLIDQLNKLADLRDRGALTEQEFAEQKVKLLSST